MVVRALGTDNMHACARLRAAKSCRPIPPAPSFFLRHRGRAPSRVARPCGGVRVHTCRLQTCRSSRSDEMSDTIVQIRSRPSISWGMESERIVASLASRSSRSRHRLPIQLSIARRPLFRATFFLRCHHGVSINLSGKYVLFLNTILVLFYYGQL